MVKSINKGKLLTSFFCLALCLLALPAWGAQKKSAPPVNSFASPDFAFPKTVEKNAAAKLDDAMKNKDGLTALQAAIQLDVASGLIDGDSYKASLARFDSLANVLEAPYNSLALMLEATLYRDIYSANAWKFNKRVLPLDPKPANVLEWSRDQVSETVCTLVSRAMADADRLAAVPLSKIEPILKDAADAVKAGFSVYDFMAVRADNLLRTFANGSSDIIPFGNYPAAVSPSVRPAMLRIELLDRALGRHGFDADKLIEAYLSNLRLQCYSGDERKDYLERCMNKFGNTPWGAAFLVDYCNSLTAEKDSDRNAVARRKYDMLTAYRDKFPNAPQIGEVSAAIDDLLSKRVNVNYQSQLLPNTPIQASVSGANVYDFYLLVYKVNGTDRSRRVKYTDLAASGAPLHAVHVKVNNASPDAFDSLVNIPALPSGLYAIVPSASPKASGFLTSSKTNSVSLALVSDLSVLKVYKEQGEAPDLYVVSAVNQKPVAGAKVTFTPTRNNSGGSTFVRTSDADGKVSVVNGNYDFIVRSGNSFLTGTIYKSYEYKNADNENLCVQLLKDLPVYRPGQEVQFSIVAYTEKDCVLDMAADRKLTVSFVDANGREVESKELVTDKLGRCNASFTIPESGLLGTWGLRVSRSTEKNADDWLTGEPVLVADYKSPTFFASIESAGTSFKAGDVLKFKGVAMTYAGMPVAGGKVAYAVSSVPLWRFGISSDASYGGETVTAADGSFTISLPTDGLVGTSFARGSYELKVVVTNPAGESQQAAPLRFSLGEGLTILASVPDCVEVNDSANKFNVTVRDLADHPVKKTLYYRLSDARGVVAQGEFETPELNLSLAGVKSGRYALSFSVTPDFKDSPDCKVVTDSLTLWRNSDVKPPVSTPLWVPVTRIVAPKGAKSVKVKVGSSFDDSWILATICTNKKPVKSEWVRVSDGIVEIPVEVPADNLQTFVELNGMRNLDIKQTRVVIIPYEQSVKLNVEQHTFRSDITPGAEQSWKFRFSQEGVPSGGIPVIAVMTNKALNDIAPFSWSFNPYGSLYRSPVSSVNFDNIWQTGNGGYFGRTSHRYPEYTFRTPTWNLYGYSLYAGRMVEELSSIMPTSMRIRGSNQLMKAAAPDSDKFMAVQESVSADEVENEVYDSSDKVYSTGAVATEAGAGSEQDNGASADVTMRQVECPIAFFMPTLSTDADGLCSLDFTAPEFVGTWQLQVLGYTPQMRGTVLTLDSKSAKKLMVQMNAPRFMRTGDKVSVAATVFNNTGEAMSSECSILISDAATDSVLAEQKFDVTDLQASASKSVSAMFDVPANVNAVTVRVIARAADCSDGEQTVVPVLPSSQPVMESETFYIAPGADSFGVKLPRYDKDASVTLSYCDNPVWECVKALPGMLEPESVSIMSKAYALFGNAVANSLFSKYPQLIDGIKQLAADSLLVSGLQTDEKLKTVMLNNTPWVNDARSETMRMQSLVDYADADKSGKSVKRLLDEIRDAQLSDGGWSWCPDMESSRFITTYVLHILSGLKNMGCLPAGAESMASKAFAYADNEFAKDWNKSKREYVPVGELLEYLYDKSAFENVGSTSSFKPLEAVALRKIASDWRDFDIKDKATAAMLLHRNGNPKRPHTILESLRQFASVSEQKGMWFANLSGSRQGVGDIIATARVLEAFDMIEPEAPAVDQLRQWLVISKQVQNWGESRYTAAAIHAILTSGSEWTASSAAPVVTLNGAPVALPANLSVTGSFTVDLDPKAASGANLEVKRSGSGPAWGGVVSSYVAPILEVKSASVPQLSIEKRVYAISQDGEARSATELLKKGDKVRVTLTIVCDRNLDYVAVTDPRAACLEPADQLSGYTSSDGVWYYREVRNAQTNLFIPYLSKGTHVINYECYVDRDGEYTLGVAQAQSQYAPVITAHSAGESLKVNNNE